jgi:hypothetical protein
MANFLNVFKAIFDKIGAFFDIFDLSFFVAGTIALGALMFQIHLMEEVGLKQERDVYDSWRAETLAALTNAVVKEASLEASLASHREHEKQLVILWGKALTAKAGTNDTNKLEETLGKMEEALGSAAKKVSELDVEYATARGDAAAKKFAAAQEPEEPKSLLTRFFTEGNLFLTIVGIYVLGLVCFAAGRPGRLVALRLLAFPSSIDSLLRENESDESVIAMAVKAHHFKREPYTTANNCSPAIINNLWAEIRESDQETSYELVKRYWVLCATYDGIAIALLIWSGVLVGWFCGYSGVTVSSLPWPLGLALGLSSVSLACFCEAQKFRQHQVYELVASAARGLTSKHKTT